MAHYILKQHIGEHDYREIARFEGGQPEIAEALRKSKLTGLVVELVDAPEMEAEPEPKAKPEPKRKPAPKGKKSS